MDWRVGLDLLFLHTVSGHVNYSFFDLKLVYHETGYYFELTENVCWGLEAFHCQNSIDYGYEDKRAYSSRVGFVQIFAFEKFFKNVAGGVYGRVFFEKNSNEFSVLNSTVFLVLVSYCQVNPELRKLLQSFVRNWLLGMEFEVDDKSDDWNCGSD